MEPTKRSMLISLIVGVIVGAVLYRIYTGPSPSSESTSTTDTESKSKSHKVTKIITKKEGDKEETTTVITEDKDKIVDKSETSQDIVFKAPNRPWDAKVMVGVGSGSAPLLLYGLGASYEILGPVSIGAWGLGNAKEWLVGGSLGVRF